MKIDNNTIVNFYMETFEGKELGDSLIDFIEREYDYSNDDEFVELLINNFILIQSEVMRDLKEINDRISCIEMEKQKLIPNSYEYRKMDYCKRINAEAKDEIEDFLVNKSISYIKDRVISKKKWGRLTDDLGKLFDVPPYKYSNYKRYYSPDYDFSTDSKYQFLHHHNPKRIQEKIDLKRNDIKSYYSDLDYNINQNSLLEKVISGVNSHHVLCKRKEIFESLYHLYKQEKYQTFINLAVIQVEGLFYDFCLILNDEIESDNFGTLSVKAERAFSKNQALWLSTYPYFAFDVPIFRNKIAHNGFLDVKDLKQFSNELIHDLFTIISAIKFSGKFPYNLLGVFLSLRKVVETTTYSPKDYKAIIIDLFGSTQIWDAKEVFDLIKGREEKREVLEFYTIETSESENTNLYDECCTLWKIIEDGKFWDDIIEILSHIEKQKKEKPYDFVLFAKSIVNNFIGTFEKGSNLKNKCILLQKELGRFKN